jgi:hypothetical protein
LDPTQILARLTHWYATRPPHTRILLALATCILLLELAFRRFAPKSKAYKHWTGLFEAIGAVWTVILLSIVYFLSVSFVALFMKLLGKDPLDRKLGQEASAWRVHEPNPLGAKAAVRHQF